MKRIVKRIFILMTVLCATVVLGNISAFAESLSLNVVYQQNINSWKIEGTAGNKAHTPVTLKIYKQELSAVTPSAIINKEGIVKLVYTKSGGIFTESFNPGTFFSSGRYIVKAYLEGFTEAEASFLHVNPDEAAGIIGSINLAESEAAVKSILDENCYQLGIDETEYNLKKDCINEIIFSHKPNGGYDTKSFLKEYNNALCIYDLRGSALNLKEVFDKHSEAIGYDYEDDIAIHDESTVAMLRERLKTADYKTLSIDDAIEENLMVSRILCVARYTFIEDIIKGEISAGTYDLTSYSLVKNKENVFKEIYNLRSEISEYPDIKTVFEKAAQAALSKEKKETSTSSGGGGGGGGGKGVSISDVKVEENTDVLKSKTHFSDTKDHWASEYISFMAEENISNGYPDGSFQPEGMVTRAEFIKFVAVAFKLSQNGFEKSFDDVKNTDWFYSYVNIAAANGIVTGDGSLLRPGDKITRQDAAVILSRIIGENGAVNSDKSFDDEEDISDYAKASVRKLHAMKIINGVNNSFLPNKNITRAEAAAMIVRLKKM